jgi:hypothetical protein
VQLLMDQRRDSRREVFVTGVATGYTDIDK